MIQLKPVACWDQSSLRIPDSFGHVQNIEQCDLASLLETRHPSCVLGSFDWTYCLFLSGFFYLNHWGIRKLDCLKGVDPEVPHWIAEPWGLQLGRRIIQRCSVSGNAGSTQKIPLGMLRKWQLFGGSTIFNSTQLSWKAQYLVPQNCGDSSLQVSGSRVKQNGQKIKISSTLRILTPQTWLIWGPIHPCYAGSNPSIRGSKDS